MSALKWFFCDLLVLVRKLASAFGHPTQASTQIQLAATCDYLRVRLTLALTSAQTIPRLVNPLPNGVASRRNLKTWGYLRIRLARACVHLH